MISWLKSKLHLKIRLWAIFLVAALAPRAATSPTRNEFESDSQTFFDTYTKVGIGQAARPQELTKALRPLADKARDDVSPAAGLASVGPTAAGRR
jgi:hypothetical protein